MSPARVTFNLSNFQVQDLDAAAGAMVAKSHGDATLLD
jgi:hypothetical protein